MKAVHGIIVQLENKRLSYNGIDIEYNFITKESKTATFSNLSMVSDFNSPLFAPDRGVVTDSDDPKILIGDTVIMDYFAVVRKLGASIELHQERPESVYEMVDGKIHIPVRTRQTPEQYVYAIFRNGNFVEYNSFQIIQPIVEQSSALIHTMQFDKVSQQLVENAAVNKCVVVHGEYAGMTCIFNPNYLLGQAQQTLIDGVQVRFIQKEFLLAEVEEMV